MCFCTKGKGALWLAGMALKTLQLRVEAFSLPKPRASVRIDPIKAEWIVAFVKVLKNFQLLLSLKSK